MLKLVLLSEGMVGRSYELSEERTTIGRADDNTFPISEASISSHHCEIVTRGRERVVRDLGSTNGTFINGVKVTESVLKPGEVLRLGQVAMRLETGVAPAPKVPLNRTVELRGVDMNELDQAGASGFHPRGTGFSKRSNSANRIFLVAAIAVGVLLGALLVYVINIAQR